MAKKFRKKIATVREHPRRLPGTFLDREEIQSIAEKYNRKSLVYPASGKLKEFKDAADKYDDLSAIWTDYFNQKFNADPKLDPDVIKALIVSESGFREDPPENKIAFGITQITKEFIFNKIRQKDLKDPEIAIPIGVRWIFRKKVMAASKPGRPPTSEEIILEYKGLLKSKTRWKDEALGNFRKNYVLLKSK